METKINANITLNVLSLEDSIPDFEMISHQLTHAGYDLKIFRVEKKKEFAAILKKNTYDIILADFSLPGFDAFGALRLCNEICPNVPFICFSGSIGEETAIELLKLGAVDYVLKDRPERLPFTIKRALDEAKIKEIHRKGENELRKLSRAVEQSPESIVITDTNGVIEYLNSTTCRLTGYTSEELIGKNPRIFSSGEKSKEEYAPLWNTITAGKEWEGEFHNKKKCGEFYWESATISPILDENGEMTHYLAIKKDVTESKKLIAELIAAKEHAEESDRLKSAFLANISHEIRTPMNGILGFAELLKEPDLTDEEQQEYFRNIEKSGTRMLNIINDIVEISKIESGQINVCISELKVKEQIESIYNFFRQDIELKGLQIYFENTLPEKDVIIRTDKEKFIAILSNLIKNAIKFTKIGIIEVGCGSASSPTGQPELQFYVKDTGIGIHPGQQEFIFKRFRQGSESLNRKYEGAGLGLSISKAFVEKLGGKIWVESEEGKGSTFYFTLPLLIEPEEKKVVNKAIFVENQEKSIRKIKILIAEDDEGCSKFLNLAVRRISKKTLSVQNGLEAIEACYNNPDIDLVLMDIQMPGMDGYKATREIRQFNTNVIIIAQTAFALSGDKEKALAAGCNDYISKPIHKDQLMALIAKNFRDIKK